MRSQEITVDVTPTPAQVLGSNPSRVCLLFSLNAKAADTTLVLIGQNLGPNTNYGICLNAAHPVERISVADYGDNITGPFMAGASATVHVRIVEGFV